MERSPFIPCDERQRETCKHGPHCEHLEATEHHLRPRRLLKAAREAKELASYQKKLRQVIYHQNNKVVAPRCVHDILDTLTSDERIPEPELDRLIGVWNA